MREIKEQLSLVAPSPLSEIQKLALNKALAMLKGAGCKYIVLLPDGTEHVLGDLKLAPPEQTRKRVQVVPMGTYKKIYEPLLKDLEIGEIAFVPCPEGLDGKGMQSACTAWCNGQWGTGSAMSHRTDTGVEIIRVA